MDWIACHCYTLINTKVIFILSSISSGLEFRSLNQRLICENSESKVFRNIKFSGEVSNNWRV